MNSPARTDRRDSPTAGPTSAIARRRAGVTAMAAILPDPLRRGQAATRKPLAGGRWDHWREGRAAKAGEPTLSRTDPLTDKELPW
ncbi:hypothetical protein GCM10009662_24470 [Catellatospora coxensis]